MSRSFTAAMAGGVAGLALAAAAAAPARAEATFAEYFGGTGSNVTWVNNVIPATYTMVPAVTHYVPPVLGTVDGRTVVVTPGRLEVITPAHRVQVTPAHDGPSGSLFSMAPGAPGVLGTAQVGFKFLKFNSLINLGVIPAAFVMNTAAGPVEPATQSGRLLLQSGIGGSFSFIYDGTAPLKVGHKTYLPGANLLTATSLTGALITGESGGSGGTFLASTSGGSTMVYSSDFIDLSRSRERSFGVHLSSLSPALRADAQAALHRFDAASGGLFAALGPLDQTSAPEPATWALMLAGFGAVGLGLRRQRAARAGAATLRPAAAA